MSKLYKIGLFIILVLPILAWPPYFFPPEWGKAIVFRIVFSIILLVFIWQIIFENKFINQIKERIAGQKMIFWIFCAVFLLALLSTIFSRDVLFSLWASPHRSGGFINFAFYILFAAILFLIAKEKDWKKFWNFSFCIGIIVVLFAAVQYYDLLPKIFIPYEGRPPSTLSSPMLLAIYLLFLFFSALSFAIKERGIKKLFYVFSLVVFLFGLFISGSRSGYLGLSAGLLYFFFFYPVRKLPLQNRQKQNSQQIMQSITTQKKSIFLRCKKFLPQISKGTKIKIAAFFILTLLATAILYLNTTTNLPDFIKNNQKLSFIADRLSVKAAVKDLTKTRFSAWQTFFKAVKEKPILGWGPENQSIAFDKNYDPSLPYLVRTTEDWWDRAHNIFLDIAAQYGLPFLLVYLFFFAYLSCWLHRLKHRTEHRETQISAHAIQAIFIAYFTDLFFEFDSVTTSIMLFFIIGYSLHLTSSGAADSTRKNAENLSENQRSNQRNFSGRILKHQKAIITTLLILLIVFLWKYNLKPLLINAEINKAEDLACVKKLPAFEKLFSQKSFLDSFLRLKYVDNVKGCENYIKDNELEYIKKSVDALKYSAKIQPNYTRTWILLAQFNNILITRETNPEIKKSLLKNSEDYLAKAQKLSPERQEVLSAFSEAYFAYGDFSKMKEYAQKCFDSGDNLSSCYWYLGLSEIALNKEQEGEKDIELAKQKGYSYDNQQSYSQLAIVYTSAKNYKKLIPVYESLISLDSQNIQYYATLAAIYKEMGEYKKAKETALEILELAPEAKEDVNAFLRTLPY